MTPEQLSEPRTRSSFRAKLLRWYDRNRRDLPWRKTKDAYRIWVSEVMLQQTRVGAVLDHYRRWFERFPTVEALARAREQSVLAAWSGLGYYRRARNLHAAAKVVVFEREGKFPATAEGLRELPGIGRYTAAAIASIAFSERAAVVDGNVERVLQRVTGNANLSSAQTWQLAEDLIAPKRPGDFNQAMMELGATVCTPREPKCLVCPVIDFCGTRGAPKRATKQARKAVPISYAFATKNDSVLLIQRARDASLMAGMWELPHHAPSPGEEPAAQFRHAILETNYEVTIYTANVTTENGHWIRTSRLPQLALTGLARKVLRHFQFL